ncbi:chemotaxis protein CheB [Lignipirellula cremea]|uniref:Chemotaxis protein methyltransferase n=1 Tax=Lignipirellula cremea TaxID=2528010 RepID=A0A518E4G9_9BACT|nr:chemotaxis protein CheB [Lignipirellula cremea]QDU98972.1 Chemotaxis protein methyltransferase [Lignipirellula cremea]
MPKKSSAKKAARRGKTRQPPRKKATPVSSQADDAEPLILVGIGASAGGLAALRTFFQGVPPDCGLTFVVVIHLSPEHESHLAELLQPHVQMPVQQVTETTALEANRVFVIPPNANLNSIDTHLRLSELEEDRRERAPIDHFFRTMAKTHDGQSIGVILSGTGSDGTLGLREIKERGGLAIVQEPSDAEYDGMPRSAIATGIVDLILPLARIADAILRFARVKPRLPATDREEDLEAEQRQVLQKIFTHLRATTGRDFSRYKQTTILRRIQRRMQLRQIEEFSGYLDCLRTNADEVRTLADDLLINVTSFFRDAEVFETVGKEIFSRLLAAKGPDESLRVWSVGCATGEEAYSLAILLLEAAALVEHPPRIQIFASDLHENSLQRARDGFYPGAIAADVSAERLTRFFHPEEGGYRIGKEARELVVFAPHNLLGDPPFSRLDLITCRNLLIYLQRKAQRDVIDLFHYALSPNGFLVLGASETVDAPELFRLEEKKQCIYQKRNVPGPEPRLPVFPLSQIQWASEPASGLASESIAYGPLHQRMVEQFAPPSLLISPDDKVVHLSQHAGRYLVYPGGELTSNIYKLVREELRMELRTALHTARNDRTPTSTKPVQVKFNGQTGSVLLHVRPALEPQQEGFVLVIFEEREANLADPSHPGAADSRDSHVPELEAELSAAYHRLQSIIEEYETAQEELRASNEEQQSANEELRSTLEELETSKEELQSMNEELQTVNQENRHKVDELAQLSSDLQNLMAATEIGTLFLDRQLRILRFTPAVTNVFNVRAADRGRPLTDLTHRLDYADLHGDAQRVLDRLAPIEREVRDDQGRSYLTRVLPYRSAEDRIEGIVVTLVDITRRAQAERDLRLSEERFRALIDASAQMVWTTDAEGQVVEDSESWRGFTGQTFEKRQGDGWLMAVHPEDRPQVADSWRQVLQEGEAWSDEFRMFHAASLSYRWTTVRAVPLRAANGKVRGWVGMNIDVTEVKRAEVELLAFNESLEQQVQQRTEMLNILQDLTRAANEAHTVDQAMRTALERICQHNGWKVGHVWYLAEENPEQMISAGIWHAADPQLQEPWKQFQAKRRSLRISRGEGMVGAAWAAAEPQWAADLDHQNDPHCRDALQMGLHAAIAFPVTVHKKVVAVLEFYSLHAAPRDARFMEIVPAVGIQLGHVLERKRLEKQIADVAEREQRRVGVDIHDGVGQELTGLRHLAQVHLESLAGKQSPDEPMARRIARGLETVQKQLRAVIRDLVPVDLDEKGLVTAIQLLAQRTSETHSISCISQCDRRIVVEDNLMARHLYRIVQEAVANAVSHAQATEIILRLDEDQEVLRLQIVDNGQGIAPAARAGAGFGLRSMSYRADLIGASLRVEAGEQGGTVVVCLAPRNRP